MAITEVIYTEFNNGDSGESILNKINALGNDVATLSAETSTDISSAVSQTSTNTSNIEVLQLVRTATEEPTGFDRRDTAYLGIIECCPFASEQIVHRIDGDGNYTELTGQTTFGDGVTPLADRTLAIRPDVSGEYHVWINGTKYIKTTTETVSISTPTAGVVLFYYNHSGILSWGGAPVEDLFSEYAIVAAVTCNTIEQKKLMFRDERHGNSMAGITHEYLHRTQGTQYVSGATVTGVVNNGTSFTTIEAGVFYDEDIREDASQQTIAPFWFREGAGGQWNSSDAANNALGYLPAGTAKYNLNTNGTWSLADIGNGYVIMHIMYSGDVKYPYVKVIGQNIYTDRNEARQYLHNEIVDLQLDGLPSPEFKFLYSYIIHNEGTGQIETGTDGEIYVDHRFNYPVSRY